MNKYTSRPITIEAAQWDGTDETSQAIRDWIERTRQAGAVVDTDHIQHLWDYDKGCYVLPSGKTIFAPYRLRCLIVLTLEGEMIAKPTDWIIRGIEGEYYPCADSVFRAKYHKTQIRSGSSSIMLQPHEYAENTIELHHFTGKLLLGTDDAHVLFDQLAALLGKETANG